MASLLTSYAQEDDPFMRPRRPFLAPSGGPPPMAVPAPVPPPTLDEPPPPPMAGAATPSDVMPQFGDAMKAQVPGATPAQPALDDPQFAAFMDEHKPNKTGRVLDAIFSGLSGKNYDSGYWQQKDQAAEQETLKDPNSPQSQMLRQAHGPMLKQLGLADDEIAHLSGADIGQMTKGGNLVEGLLRARQSAATTKAQHEEKLRQEQHAHDEEVAKEERAAEIARKQAEFTGNTPETKKEIAALQGGMTGQREMQQAVLASNLGLRNQQAMADVNEQNRVEAERRAEQRKLDEEARKHAYEEAHPKAGQGEPLRVEDIEGTGWTVDDPTSAARIINKRALTKAVIPQMADARTAIESLDKVIANREKYGSDPARWNPKVTEDNDLYMATIKQNYKNAMGMPNTDSSEKELAHLFPDPNAVTGKGVGGIVKGIGATVGATEDPVLAELKAARAEAVHNLSSKIPIPSVRYVGSGKYKGNASAGEHGGEGKAGVRIRDPKSGRTGSFQGTAAEAKAEGYEVL